MRQPVTVRMGQTEQDRQDSQNGAGRTGQAERDGRTGQAEWNRQDR
jgi:hypothetical protein